MREPFLFHLFMYFYQTMKSLPELRLREILGWLIAARSGHGHFAAYHERFGHEETDSNCVCGQKRAQLHPFSRAHARKHRLHLWCNKRQRQLASNEVLGTDSFCKVGTRDRVVSSALRNERRRWRRAVK